MECAQKRRSVDELEQLKREAMGALDRLLTAIIDRSASLQIPAAAHAENGVTNFVRRIMTEIFKNDLQSHLLSEDAGWRTIHQFYRHCNKVYPGWASKQTFYHRMNSSLVYLLAQDISQKRSIKKRLGKGRAKYEFRINPDHVVITD